MLYLPLTLPSYLYECDDYLPVDWQVSNGGIRGLKRRDMSVGNYEAYSLKYAL